MVVVLNESSSVTEQISQEYLPPGIELICSVIYADIGAPISQGVELGREKLLGRASVPVHPLILLQKLKALLSQ